MTAGTADHTALLQDSEVLSKESFDSGDGFESRNRNYVNGEPSRFASRSLLLVHIGVLLLYTAAFFTALTYVFSSKADIPLGREDLRNSPMRDAIHYDVRTVAYNFEDVNLFKGQPVAEIDEQWLKVLNQAHEVRYSQEEMQRSNLSSIKLADGSEDYLVQPIVYHMLHCLYNIYKYAHPDFYGDDPSGPDWIVTHTDHCVDNLRQFVTCHAGTGVSTFKWLDSRKLPWPVLSTEETCVDWAHYDGWVRDHSVDMQDILSFKHGNLLVHPTLGPLFYDDFAPKKKGAHEHQHEH